MSLVDIASGMKHIARRDGKTESRMAKGAHLKLECTRGRGIETFTLTITRVGKAPTLETAHKKWQTEINTFARYFVPVNTPHTFPNPQPAPRGAYNAAIRWDEPLPNATSGIPQNAAEIAAWARTLGPGVKIRNVDVFTGEV